MIDITNIITSVAYAVVAIIALITAVLSFFSFKTSKENQKAIAEVHVIMNSRLTELLEITRKASKAEGVIEGKAASFNNKG